MALFCEDQLLKEEVFQRLAELFGHPATEAPGAPPGPGRASLARLAEVAFLAMRVPGSLRVSACL